MRRAWMIVFVCLIATFSFAAGRRFPARDGASLPPPEEAVRDVSGLARALRLTPAQQDEIRALNDALAAQLKEGCDRHCEVRCRIARTLSESASDTSEAEELTRKLGRIQTEIDIATLRHVLRVRDALDPEQRRRFLQRFQSCVCETCPAGTRCCAAETHEAQPNPENQTHANRQ